MGQQNQIDAGRAALPPAGRFLGFLSPRKKQIPPACRFHIGFSFVVEHYRQEDQL
jgi:hypothetical protein